MPSVRFLLFLFLKSWSDGLSFPTANWHGHAWNPFVLASAGPHRSCVSNCHRCEIHQTRTSSRRHRRCFLLNTTPSSSTTDVYNDSVGCVSWLDLSAPSPSMLRKFATQVDASRKRTVPAVTSSTSTWYRHNAILPKALRTSSCFVDTGNIRHQHRYNGADIARILHQHRVQTW